MAYISPAWHVRMAPTVIPSRRSRQATQHLPSAGRPALRVFDELHRLDAVLAGYRNLPAVSEFHDALTVPCFPETPSVHDHFQ